MSNSNVDKRPFNAADARVIQAARNLYDYLDKLIPAKLLMIGCDEEVVGRGLVSRLEDLKVALLCAPHSPDCPRCWRTLEQRVECTDERCMRRIPEGHRSLLAVALESGSPLAPRGINPEGDASVRVCGPHGCTLPCDYCRDETMAKRLNAYPELIHALRNLIDADRDTTTGAEASDWAIAVLKDLGEWK